MSHVALSRTPRLLLQRVAAGVLLVLVVPLLVSLGTFDVTGGWNRVALSRWTTEGSVVVADAVRVTER